jgi:hypothetical protein
LFFVIANGQFQQRELSLETVDVGRMGHEYRQFVLRSWKGR